MQHVVPGDLSLLHGQVHYLVRPCAVAPGENMRCTRLHLRIADDAASLRLDAGVPERERRGVRRAAQPVENRLCPHFASFPGLLVDDDLIRSLGTSVLERATGVDGDAFVAKSRLHLGSSIVIKIPQDMCAALQHRHLNIEPCKKLGEFQRHSPTAQHYDRLGQHFQFKRIVTGHTAQLGQGRQRQFSHARPC